MANDSTLGKRVFTLAVVAMTILWTLGASAVAPLTASALSAGDLVRGTSFSTVYYYGSNGMRYTFPNEKTYFSWYSDFSGVSTISDAALAAIPLGGNVVYRPGTYWVKIQSDPKVYAVSPDGMLHWIESESAAVTVYGGSSWNTFIQDVPDAFFADYSVGTSLTGNSLYDGALVASGGKTYLVWGGMKREVSSAGMSANRLQSRFVMNTSVDVAGIANGAALSAKSDEVSDTAQMATGDGSSTPVATGGLSLSVASDNPAGATLPRGANGVEVLKLSAKAAGGASTVNSVVLSLGGVGAATNVSNVYLYSGAERLTESRSVNSSTRQVTFSSLGFQVNDGQTRPLSVVVETSTAATAADTMAFRIGAAADVSASGAVNGSFPLSGNTYSFSGNSVGTITIAKTGSITNPSLGQQNSIVGKFQLSAATEDARVERLRLRIDNASDHKDFALYQGSTKVATGVRVTGDFVDFVFDSVYIVPDGNNKAFDVKLTVGGQSGETITVLMDKDTDLIAKGGDFGFNMAVTRANYDGGTAAATESNGTCAATTSDCSFSTIQGGDVTFAFNGPVAGDLHTNSQDNPIFTFSLTSKQSVTVKDIDFIVVADDDADGDAFDGVEAGAATSDDDGLINSGAEANLKDIKVRYTSSGNTLMGPLELDTVTDSAANEDDSAGLDGDAEDADQVIDFTDDFSIAAGQTLDLQLTADVDNNTAANTIFGAVLDVSGIV
ncbi:hypothetical protein HYV72_01215, partial [Candidatus Uhrbacteria bacterium]|nr:hypothetical protein [Candidatus Uhrbacteria bacterium]